MAQQIATYAAALFCALFTGAAFYISAVEHPARLQCGSSLAITEFRPSYRRGTVLQVSCALLGSLASVLAWLVGASQLWLVGGILLLAVIPFTLLAIFPTNRALLDPALDPASLAAVHLLKRWGQLHAVRTVLSLLSLFLFLGLLVSGTR